MAKPIPFTKFARDVLRRRYTPAQLVYAKIAFDHIDPIDLPPSERVIAAEMFGPSVDRVPPEAHRIKWTYFGRDSGKTLLAEDVGNWRAVTADVSTGGPGEISVVLVGGPDVKIGRALVRRALETARATPQLAARLVNVTTDGFMYQREGGRLVAFELAANSRGAADFRGRKVQALLIDEADFTYFGDLYVKTDASMVNAVLPRLDRDGFVWGITTPFADDTYGRKQHAENFGRPKSALVAVASTPLMRDHDPEVMANVDALMASDPRTARQEFYCDMTLSAGSAFGDPTILADCFQDSLPEGYEMGPVIVGTDLSTMLTEGNDECGMTIGGWLIPSNLPRYQMLRGVGGAECEARDELGYRIQKPAQKKSIFRIYESAEFSTTNGETQESAVRKIIARGKEYGAKIYTGDTYSEVSARGFMSRGHAPFFPLPWNSANKMSAVSFFGRLAREGSLSIATSTTGALRKEMFALKYRHVGGGRTEYATNGLDVVSALLSIGVYLTSSDAAGVTDRDPKPLEGTPYRGRSGGKNIIEPGERGSSSF